VSIRYALIATFVHVRLAEVIDDVVKMLVEIIQRLDRRSDQQVYRELLRDLQRVEGKIQILFRVAEVVITKPEGTIREVLVPIQGVVPRGWTEHVFEEVKGEAKVNRHYYELCVLQQLQRALKCKEIWVEGAHAFRNPNDDLPADWDNVGRRIAHYEKLGLPVEADHFVENLRGRMTAALQEFDRILPRQSHLRIYCPNKSRPDRGLFAVAKLERQKEPKSLDLIKDGIVKDFGMLDLLDIFVEADRLVDFTRFFIHSGTKEVRSREALRPLLILDLFAEGTNMGIKRLANSNDRYSYEELLYVRKMYFSPEALRNANAAVVNKVLEIRNRAFGEKVMPAPLMGRDSPVGAKTS
jgi:hypothetical protein